MGGSTRGGEAAAGAAGRALARARGETQICPEPPLGPSLNIRQGESRALRVTASTSPETEEALEELMSDIKKAANKVRSKLKSESGLQALPGMWGARSPWGFTD